MLLSRLICATFPREREVLPLQSFALHRCRCGSQLLDQLLREAQDGKHSYRQQDVGDHCHRVSIRDKPFGLIGDQNLGPVCNLALDKEV